MKSYSKMLQKRRYILELINEKEEVEFEATQRIIKDKIPLGNKMSNNDEFECEEKIKKLKLDLKRSNILLKDAQKQLVFRNDHVRNRKLIN
jgi:glycerol-3-phosphate cytidylyltransferase-like family protein